MQPIMIEVKNLATSPLNARRTAVSGTLEELKASILAHGLMQNLLVTAAGDGTFRVIAGGRRFEALRALQEEGTLPGDYAVPCQVAGDKHAAEMSLAENVVRLAMHPADEFEAFARLIERGDDVQRIAARFGVTTRHVEQRLRLGRIAPPLLDAYRAEELTLECLMAFAVTDDRAKQVQVYETLTGWCKSDPDSIREALTETLLEADGKIARFVGLDAYHAAGGTSHADLFGDRVYLETPELLHRLAAQKLEGVRRELEAEGWAWVEVSPDRDWSFNSGCGRIYRQQLAVPPELLAEQERAEAQLEAIREALDDTESEDQIEEMEAVEAKLSDIEDQIASLTAYDPGEMRSAGCYVSIGHDGELVLEKGLVRREDKKRLADAGGAHPAKPKGMPETLRRDLEAYRLQAAQVEIARHRLIALDLLAFKAARSVVAMRPVSAGPDVQFTRHQATPPVQHAATIAGRAFEAIRDSLPMAWLHQRTEAEQFQAFLSLSDKEKLDFLAYGVAASLKPQLSTGGENSAYELALSLTDADLANYWRPTRANYLARISRDQLLALGRDLLGEQWAHARSRDKKDELADSLEQAFAHPEKAACSPEQRVRLGEWLPEGMEFGAAEATVSQANLVEAA
jgi:ParB family chromosome partitioning protein